MSNYSLTITCDKPNYGKNEQVVLTAWTQPWIGSSSMEIQVWDDNNGRKFDELFDKADSPNGTVTCKVPGSTFTGLNPIYEAQVLYNGHRAHVKFNHW